MHQYIYIKCVSDSMITPYDDVTEFFDSAVGMEMSQEERHHFIRYGHNSTHRVVEKSAYDEAEEILKA